MWGRPLASERAVGGALMQVPSLVAFRSSIREDKPTTYRYNNTLIPRYNTTRENTIQAI
jgi:hypothetical protein